MSMDFKETNIFSTEISLVEFIEENGIKINNTLEVSNVFLFLKDLNYEYENYIINKKLSVEKKIEFAKKEFNERYKYKVIKNSLLQKILKNNGLKELVVHFDEGIIQYIDRGLQSIDVTIYLYSLEIDLNFSVDILNILKLLERIIRKNYYSDFKLNFTILIGRAYIYLNKE